MKTLFFAAVIAAASLPIVSCTNSTKTADTTKAPDSNATVDTKTVVHSPTGSDVKTISPIKGLITNYLDLKNGLVKENGEDAATAAKAMVAFFVQFDVSALTEEQKKSYTDIANDAKEMAEHIGKNPDKLEHQREHFDMLSQDMVDLVKLFGAGQTLYVDHCPMYNDKKGANWLSETKEIKNPFMGSAMATCGSVIEQLN